MDYNKEEIKKIDKKNEEIYKKWGKLPIITV